MSGPGERERRDPAAEETLDLPPDVLAPGRVLGGRYEVRRLLGRGGMGEVWHAFDLKLRVEVALKALRRDHLQDERRRELVRREVRAAREVVSPNVCRVFDLVEVDGHELVSMEYVDGQTLLDVLRERGPLELKQAQDIASQFLSGLESIHKAGIVHRDIKPENIMVTWAGRVVVMDLGLAKERADRAGSVSGTPAYMAPEQAAGLAVDARADVYSAGVVLAEMVSPGGVKDLVSRQSVWEGVRYEPVRLPDTPWAPVLRKAVAKEPAQRFATAHTLIRALEEVTLRVEGAEDLRPYPGLASFTEADAEYFFGREAEVEQTWRRLQRPHVTALIGPSGTGKSSFLRAGLAPARPPGWAHVVCTPGDAPLASLRRAVISEIEGDAEALRDLAVGDEDATVSAIGRWRRRHEQVLVVVDQFEELFTLNPREVQASFAVVLGRLALEADARVLLSMRDDFLMRCNEHEDLAPIFSELTPLKPLAGAALRRALVQPATTCGYRFQDEALVDEMLHAVEGERGALPLLAFAAASLWDRRDRSQGLLTREAHQAIGGVAGALAQHAEATLERIGQEKLPLVRELFRNLVTAEGTRAVRDVEEVLTVFTEAQRPDAEAVLRNLIDARLLTSYEAHAAETGRTAGRRVEVVHESLLASWPRLVRWRTEDEGSAQLRDQLRQAARLWEEKGKPDDLLWTGTSYQEYQVWRSRYPGGLSEIEATFAGAMAARAARRRRVRRSAVAAVITVLVAVAIAIGISRQQAVAAAHQAEAAQLLSLGRLRLVDKPKAALAYAMASLEESDGEPARRFAVEALWQCPPAFFLPYPNPWEIGWSPDGRWLALGRESELDLLERGSQEIRTLSPLRERVFGFTVDGRRLVTAVFGGGAGGFRVWALPEGRLERTLELAGRGMSFPLVDGVLALRDSAAPPEGRSPFALVHRLAADGSGDRVLGRWTAAGPMDVDTDPNGRWLVYWQQGRVFRQPLDDLSAPARLLGSHEASWAVVTMGPWLDRAVTSDSEGDIRIWDVAGARLERTLKIPGDASFVGLDPTGRYLATPDALVDLAAPRAAEPLPLRGGCEQTYGLRFSADGAWLAPLCDGTGVLWSTAGPRSTVLARNQEGYAAVVFTPDGGLLSSQNGVVTRWFLDPVAEDGARELWSPGGLSPLGLSPFALEVDPAGRFAVTTEVMKATLSIAPLDGSRGSTHVLKSASGTAIWDMFARLDPSGQYVAVEVWSPGHPDANATRIVDLASGEERALDTHPKGQDRCEAPGSDLDGAAQPVWLWDGRLVTDGDAGLRLWDLASGTSRLLRPCRKIPPSRAFSLLATPDSRAVLRLDMSVRVGEVSSLVVTDISSGETRELTSHGKDLKSFALDPSGTILVTGDVTGIVRVGALSGGEPHLLFGHAKAVWSVAVSPDGRTIASGSEDGTIRLWPMPDLSKPPLHTLPHDELLVTLKALTNLRAVRDPSSDTGWKVEVGPFPGWANVPEWQP